MNELRIISGLHRGVSLPLDDDTIIVGSSLEADIALVDPGIAEQHVKIQSNDQLPEGCWLFTVLNDQTWDEKGELISDAVTAKLNHKFNIGGVWLMFSDDEAPWPSGEVGFVQETVEPEEPQKVTPLKDKSFLVKAYSAAAGVLIGVVTLTHAGGDNTESDPVLTPPPIVEKQANFTKYEKNALSLVQEKPMEELLLSYRKMLKERNLEGVEIASNGTQWDIQGALTANDAEKLKRMNLRFKRKYGEAVQLNNIVETVEESLPFDIVRVVSGPMGHIEADDGHKLYVGNDYKGLKLVGINKDTIMFSGKNNIEVKW